MQIFMLTCGQKLSDRIECERVSTKSCPVRFCWTFRFYWTFRFCWTVRYCWTVKWRLAEDRFVGSGITRALGQQRLPVPVVILKPQTQQFLLIFPSTEGHQYAQPQRPPLPNRKFFLHVTGGEKSIFYFLFWKLSRKPANFPNSMENISDSLERDVYFCKNYFAKCIFAKCTSTWLTNLLSFASVFTI